MHYSCALFPYISLWQFIFFHVPLFSCYAFFKLRHFHVTIFYAVIFSCCTFFGVSLFLCIALFHVALFHNVFVLHFSPVALIVACCNFFLLPFLHVVLFPEVKPGLPQTSKMESFATINETVKYCFTTLHLRCSRGPHYASTISMMRFFHATLFITIFMFRSNGCFCMLHFFNIEKYWKWTKDRKHNRKGFDRFIL